MNEMIERVADALDASSFKATGIHFHDREVWVRQARIAIEAMRDPTAYMLDVADAIEPRDRVVLIWRVMIDKALE